MIAFPLWGIDFQKQVVGLIKQFIAEGGADFMVKPIGEDFEKRVDAILDKAST